MRVKLKALVNSRIPLYERLVKELKCWGYSKIATVQDNGYYDIIIYMTIKIDSSCILFTMIMIKTLLISECI